MLGVDRAESLSVPGQVRQGRVRVGPVPGLKSSLNNAIFTMSQKYGTNFKRCHAINRLKARKERLHFYVGKVECVGDVESESRRTLKHKSNIV